MGKGSAFARVIGLTKSLTVFDRSGPGDDGDEAPAPATDVIGTEATEALAASAAAEAVPGPPVAPDPAPGDYGKDEPVVTADPPALQRVTVVAAGPAPAMGDAAQQVSEVPLRLPVEAITGEEAGGAITADAISAIEADIASLLASLDRDEMLGDTSADEIAAGEQDSDEDETSMGDLLLELDRLWRTDPEIAAHRPY